MCMATSSARFCMSSTWSEFRRVGKWLRATNSTAIPAAWRISSSEETIWPADPRSVVRPNRRSRCLSVNSGAAGASDRQAGRPYCRICLPLGGVSAHLAGFPRRVAVRRGDKPIATAKAETSRRKRVPQGDRSATASYSNPTPLSTFWRRRAGRVAAVRQTVVENAGPCG